MMNLSTYKVK